VALFVARIADFLSCDILEPPILPVTPKEIPGLRERSDKATVAWNSKCFSKPNGTEVIVTEIFG